MPRKKGFPLCSYPPKNSDTTLKKNVKKYFSGSSSNIFPSDFRFNKTAFGHYLSSLYPRLADYYINLSGADHRKWVLIILSDHLPAPLKIKDGNLEAVRGAFATGASPE